MSIYQFNEPGCISGIPGTFAGVMVEVDDEAMVVVKVSPLSRHSAFIPAETEPIHEAAAQPLQADALPAESSPVPPQQEEQVEREQPSQEEAYHMEPPAPDAASPDPAPAEVAPAPEDGQSTESEQ